MQVGFNISEQRESVYSMGKNQSKDISAKALVDKQNNKIIFVEANKDFADVLFSFLTMPMGTIVRLLRKQPPTFGIDCINNLYASVENLGVQQFRTAACKSMLLCPRNGAGAQCNRLNLKIDDTPPLKYFLCSKKACNYKLLSHYHDICGCGEYISREMDLSLEKPKQSACGSSAPIENYTEVFVKEQTQLIISEGLQVMPSSTEASLSLLSKLALTDWTTIEERNLHMGVDEVLTLLKCSLVSKTPLTDTLLKKNPIPQLGKEDFNHGNYIKSGMKEPPSSVNKKIQVKLMISKSKKMVCYAEASEDFVDLLFSFLTLPLGYIVKEMHSSIAKGCINLLYNSVHELDAEKYLISNEQKGMLVNPKLAPDFGYENHPLGIEEHKHPPYYCAYDRSFDASPTPRMLTSVKTLIPGNVYGVSELTVVDPKSGFKKTTRGGFVMGPARFTVTDNLIVTPISPISSLSLLNKLNVPVDDIEERVVRVGHVEALRLMVASFVSESVLTNVLLSEPMQNKLRKS